MTRIIYEILVSVAKVIAPITRGVVLGAIQVARLVKLILTLAYELMLAPTYENIFLPLYNNVLVPFIERLVVPCWHLCWRAVHFVVAEFIAPSLNYVYFTITCRTRLARPLVIIGILLCFTGALMLGVQSLGRLLNWDATGCVNSRTFMLSYLATLRPAMSSTFVLLAPHPRQMTESWPGWTRS